MNESLLDGRAKFETGEARRAHEMRLCVQTRAIFDTTQFTIAITSLSTVARSSVYDQLLFGHGRACHMPSDGLAHFVIQPVRETVAKVNWFEYQLVGGRL